MILTDLYQTKIECVQGDTTTPYYNVKIDATDVTVIISLIDFNGNPVKNKPISLSVDIGTITGLKSDGTALLASDHKSISGNTNSNGQMKVGYTASEWGLATFSVNNSNTQIHITGRKRLQTVSSSCFVDGDETQIEVVFTSHKFSCSPNSNTTVATIDSQYAPSNTVMGRAHNTSANVTLWIDSRGTCTVRNNTSSNLSNQNITTSLNYMRK